MEIKRKIPFRVLHSTQSYSNKEGIKMKSTDNKIIIEITKEFATPGYSMDIEEVVKKDRDCIIYLSIVPPKVDAMLMQVITYKTKVIEIDIEEIGEFKEVEIKFNNLK